ncbi:N-lysine methyltransferase SMYD2-A [Hyalella azteca]|uniref:N-lysine methyltransferase SMYD2-A n=1 Tax=Hyalella azteca TaxID=294128 RepID=A0A8B7NQY2_HYAAZ|nr:N-lysine methyltransferase SMYD2-A [Hyalella azteca]
MSGRVTMREGQRVRRGDVIMRGRPFVHILFREFKKHYCDQCIKKRESEPCPGCGQDFYCSDACRQEALPLHSLECARLKAYAPECLSDFARFMARTILKLRNGGDREWVVIDNKLSRQFRHMMTHSDAMAKCEKRSQDLANKKGELRSFFGKDYPLTDEFFLDVYSKIKVNNFGMMSEECFSLGQAIYIDAAIYNHSCQPNAVLCFDGTEMTVRATVDVTRYHRDLFQHSYIDHLAPWGQRQRQLLLEYCFECRCQRCSDEYLTALENTLNCGNPKCEYPVEVPDEEDMAADMDGGPLKLQCPRCSYSSFPEDVVQQYRRLVTEYEHVIEYYYYPDDKSDLEYVVNYALTEVTRRQSKDEGGHMRMLLHPFNIHRIRLLEAAYDSAIELTDAVDALKFAELNIEGIKHRVGEFGQLYGNRLLEMGKLCVRLERYKKALRHFREAERILEVCLGPENRLVQEELRPLMEATSQVLGLIRSSSLRLRDFQKLDKAWKQRHKKKIQWIYYAYGLLIVTMVVLGVTGYR